MVERDLARVVDEIDWLRDDLASAERTWGDQIRRVHPDNVASALNLAHYWAIRQYDLRDLQQRLATFGLSSLGRSEPHVRASLDAIARAAGAVLGAAGAPDGTPAAPVGFTDGSRLLRQRTASLLGPAPEHRRTRIMVTLPSEAAGDRELVRDLVEHGMDLARINCAHDGPDAWAAMVANVRAAGAAVGRRCRIAMDLAGPKLRTGPLADGPRLVVLRPRRDTFGRVVTPASCWLTSPELPAPPPRLDMAVLPVPARWLARLAVGDSVRLRDTRGARRTLTVVDRSRHGVLAQTDHTVYVTTGTELVAGERSTTVGPLPPLEQYLTLRPGDTVLLTKDCRPAPVPADPPRIGCTLPEVFGHVRPGQAVHFDDGRISGTVLDADDETITVRITTTAKDSSRLRAAKGINLPDTVVPVGALTSADRRHLPFVAEHADLVELSFVRGASDVDDLVTALDDLGDDRLGVVVKIETAQGFRQLPDILLAAMRRPNSGVMIARGDLAVECGYERVAELQEEILWLCEAAHLPVIWATQVLDQLARRGQPSRAEITDAAMGVRAECVMLNKGPHIIDAVVTLDDILVRMAAHHYKKNALMRPLRSWRAVS